LDNDSLLIASANLQSLGGSPPPGYSVEVVSVTGSMTITYFDNQSVAGEQNGLTLTSVGTGPDGNTLTTEGSYNGTATATYQIRKVEGQNTITYSNAEYALTYTQTLIFGDVLANTLPPISMDDTNFSFFLSGTELYDCSESVLLFTSAPTLGAIQFTRVVP
jgi:hypothetical protein